MKTTFVIGILAYQMICSISSRSPTDCASRMATCVSESDLCRSGWALLRNVCHVTAGSCRIMESEVCNMTIQYMLDQFPVWSGCLCLGKDYCSAPQLLAPQCFTHSDSHTSNRPPQWSWTEPDPESGLVTPQSCLSALHSCRESRHCWTTYEKLRDSCSPDKDPCDTSSSCLLLWEELRSTPIASCTCPTGRRRCQRVWTLLHNNPCVHTTQEVLPLPDDRLQNHLQGGDVRTSQETRSSCLQTMMVCVQDEVCNRQLVPLVRACSVSQCEGVLCEQATRRFYDGLPHDVAEILVFCECAPADRDCLRVKLDLQSGICFGRLDQLPTCLEAHDICVEDPLCRQRYEKFWSKCFGGEEDTLYHGYVPGDCLSTLGPDLILAGNIECRKAFVGMMGTVLQQPCTCDGLANMDLHRCKKLYEVLHNRSIFRECSEELSG
ncbi:GDNF family receptor alpha-like [Megalops cyprinoides]|uniref:GDNF family receptor alpha-like n=1 Tax=Megalops cyprinoides TaxID=118141 RepID=UPI001863A2C3|nr:GDNF family receptor alpha-like [Megalops cyprinoides]